MAFNNFGFAAHLSVQVCCCFFLRGVVVFIQALRFFFVCPLTEMTIKAGEINETITLMTNLMFIELILEKKSKH